MKDHLPTAPNSQAIAVAEVEKRMVSLRGQSVLLDRDVASLYGVETKHVNQAVRNNPGRFPAGYVLELSEMELHGLRSNFLTANVSNKSRVPPKAFTERGLYMLATVLIDKDDHRIEPCRLEDHARNHLLPPARYADLEITKCQ